MTIPQIVLDVMFLLACSAVLFAFGVEYWTNRGVRIQLRELSSQMENQPKPRTIILGKNKDLTEGTSKSDFKDVYGLKHKGGPPQ